MVGCDSGWENTRIVILKRGIELLDDETDVDGLKNIRVRTRRTLSDHFLKKYGHQGTAFVRISKHVEVFFKEI